jgi:sugar O-acyltransferase (sialic acid O-acetyltransferase NeuD family)
MENKKYALIGRGGHAREVEQFLSGEVTMFDHEQFISSNYTDYVAMIAVGDSNLRKKIYDALPKNVNYFSFIHPSSFIGNNVTIGLGSFIGPNCVLTTNISVGHHSVLLRGCHVGHESEVGDFTSMMSNSVINGNCKVGQYFYLGTNASVKEKITICDNVKIGLNSGVIRDILTPGVYVGCPARRIK